MDEKANGERGIADGGGLEALDRRFRQWRESRRRGEHIPLQLWAAAAGMAREHGVSRIAKRLGLNVVALNRRMHSAAEHTQAGAGDTKFVELFAAPAVPAATAAVMRECVIELENERGAKMRVELNGAGLAGLAHLCRGFWGAA
jgi:hypothetical protein